VRTLARLLDQKAGDLDEEVERLKRARSRLSNAWSGGSREKRFISQYNSLLKKMDAEAHELQALSVRVYREVDEWERVDSGFGKRKNFLGKYWDEIKDVSIDDGVRLLATGMIISKLKAGSYYAGEVIFNGSRALKDSAGFFPTLTHIRVDHIPQSLLKNALGKITPLEIGLAVMDFGGRAIKDWGQYEDGSERATAIGLDAAFVAGKTVGLHYAGYALASVATGGLLSIGAPVVFVAGAGIAVWWGVSYLGGKALDTGFETYKDDIVHGGGKLLDQTGVAIGNAAQSITSSASQIGQTIDDAFSGFRSKLLSFT
jgi:uncharacterized protein YukE